MRLNVSIKMLRMRMKESITSKTYDVWSWFYDYTFGALVWQRQKRAVKQLHCQKGDRVLDLGVGTGMLLPLYPKDVTVVGIDLSEGMLAKADKRKGKQGLDQCLLVQGDAMLPPFADASFDHIVITHVITVVSDPHKLLDWAARLLKPGGRIVMLNHFQSDNPIVAWFEHVLNPMFIKIGWRSDLAMEDALRGADVSVLYSFKMGLIDLWRIVVMTHRRPGDPLVRPISRPAGGLWARWRRRRVATNF